MELSWDGMDLIVRSPQRIPEYHDRMMLVEFSRFLNVYLKAKKCAQDHYWMDAYALISEALTYWANIAMLQEGQIPQERIWEQTRKHNIGVYKLFEEFSISGETLEQRIELAILACDFSIISKMERCCALLFQIMDSRLEPWSIEEIMEHEALHNEHIDLESVMQRLALKSLVQEVVVAVDNQSHQLERKFRHS